MSAADVSRFRRTCLVSDPPRRPQNIGPSVTKEHWLVEQSGMLWGQFSETLTGWIPHKGMLFGETGRAPAANMKGLYAFWDAIRIEQMAMCGWWNTTSAGCPARTSDPENVPLTSFACAACGEGGRSAAMFVIASFAPAPLNVTLAADWARLGFDAERVELSVPAVAGVQGPAMTVARGAALAVPPSAGHLIVAQRK